MNNGSLITLPVIVWDPHLTSVVVRDAVALLGRLMGNPVEGSLLHDFQQAVISVTPTSQSDTIIYPPLLRLNSKVTVVYDNGVHEDTEAFENVPSLLVSGVTYLEHQYGAQLSQYGLYVWGDPHKFRLIFNRGLLALGTGTLTQRPLKNPLP